MFCEAGVPTGPGSARPFGPWVASLPPPSLRSGLRSSPNDGELLRGPCSAGGCASPTLFRQARPFGPSVASLPPPSLHSGVRNAPNDGELLADHVLWRTGVPHPAGSARPFSWGPSVGFRSLRPFASLGGSQSDRPKQTLGELPSQRDLVLWGTRVPHPEAGQGHRLLAPPLTSFFPSRACSERRAVPPQRPGEASSRMSFWNVRKSAGRSAGFLLIARSTDSGEGGRDLEVHPGERQQALREDLRHQVLHRLALEGRDAREHVVEDRPRAVHRGARGGRAVGDLRPPRVRARSARGHVVRGHVAHLADARGARDRRPEQVELNFVVVVHPHVEPGRGGRGPCPASRRTRDPRPGGA